MEKNYEKIIYRKKWKQNWKKMKLKKCFVKWSKGEQNEIKKKEKNEDKSKKKKKRNRSQKKVKQLIFF